MASSAAEKQMMRVAIVTGGTRGIGRGITEALVASGQYSGLILSYNTNRDAAEHFVSELLQQQQSQQNQVRIELVGGDISLETTRNAIFQCFDEKFGNDALGAVIHNAGQYVGITSDNVAGLEKRSLFFGDGSMLKKTTTGDDDSKESVDFDIMHYYQRMYGEAYIDLCERGLKRMRDACERCSGNENFRGSLIGISSPGCNFHQRPSLGYDLPGAGKSTMEYSMRLFALRAAALGVNCNVIIPGATITEAWTRTEEARGVEKGKIFHAVKDRSPMGMTISPRDIGDAVAFLCGGGGGKYITGVSLPVDGGFHLRH